MRKSFHLFAVFATLLFGSVVHAAIFDAHPLQTEFNLAATQTSMPESNIEVLDAQMLVELKALPEKQTTNAHTVEISEVADARAFSVLAVAQAATEQMLTRSIASGAAATAADSSSGGGSISDIVPI